MRILEEFDKVTNVVNKDRRSVYGHPEPNYEKVARIRSVIDYCPDPVLREVLGMIGLKIARLTQSPDHLDSWIDVAGYARVAAMILDARQRREPIPVAARVTLGDQEDDPSANPERPD